MLDNLLFIYKKQYPIIITLLTNLQVSNIDQLESIKILTKLSKFLDPLFYLSCDIDFNCKLY